MLLSFKSASTICRIETGRRLPSVRAALALQVIFEGSPAQLFPKLYEEIEGAVMRRAYKLHQKLQGDPSASTRAKLDFLESVQHRARDRKPHSKS